MNKYALSLAAAACLAMQVEAKPVLFQVDQATSKNRDVVSFTSDAPIELIVGRTNKISGKVTIDDSLDLNKKPLEASFTVDLASIDTGIELRNEHMRDNFLQTKTYPTATFVLKTLQGKAVTLKPGQKVKLMALGSFTVHGKTVQKVVPVEVTYLKKCGITEKIMPGCDLLQIRANFDVKFQDHGIQRPEIVFQKLADTVIVSVAASAWSKTGPSAGAPATPVKKASQ